MHIEGRLQIDLYPVQGALNTTRIQSTRPLAAARVFEGKSPDKVLMQLPLLFSVCGVAQGVAAIRAFHQALELPVKVSVDNARKLLVQMETAREHLWRILIDWPELLQEKADVRGMVTLQTMLPNLRNALFADGESFLLDAELQMDSEVLQQQINQLETTLTEQIFALPVAQWLAIEDSTQLQEWVCTSDTVASRLLAEVFNQEWQSVGATAMDLLPELSVSGLNMRLAEQDADNFIAEPVWQDKTYETTSYARQREQGLVSALQAQFGNGLLTRLVARLTELALVPESMRDLQATLENDQYEGKPLTLPEGIGIGQTEAARGRLLHRVVMQDKLVSRYQILAPTEWNFHPQGLVANALSALPENDEQNLRRQAAMLINAVDPCVGYDLQVH